MDKPIKALIVPDCTEIAYEYYEALRFERNLELIGGSDMSRYSKISTPRHFIRNVDNKEEFIEDLDFIVNKYGVDVILGAHDKVFIPILKNSQFKDKLVTSSLTAWKICRDKSLTYEYFKGFPHNTVQVPETYNLPKAIFTKPKIGNNSRGCTVYDLHPEYVYMEELTGKEYTVDCFSVNGHVKYQQVRERINTRDGMSIETRVDSLTYEFESWSRTISIELELNGAWFYQVKFDSNNIPKLLEITPRIAGGSSITRFDGVNLPLLSIYNHLEYPLRIDSVTNTRRICFKRYQTIVNSWDYTGKDIKKIYVDYDDTISFSDGSTNYELVGKLIGLRSAGIDIFFLSKHTNVYYSEVAYMLSSGREVTDDKSQFAKPGVILIDDSFSERKAFQDAGGIALGLDCLEILEYLIRTKK